MDDNRQTCGKVWLVGAGPGDIGLLTIKGYGLLKEADVIVYDHLVGRSLLTVAGEHGRMINVGKEAGHHPVAQERINQILVEEARKGNSVVRLKGGDPFYLAEAGKNFRYCGTTVFPLRWSLELLHPWRCLHIRGYR